MVRSAGSPTRLSASDGASILIMFSERKACGVAVSELGPTVEVAEGCIGADAVAGTAEAHELQRSTNRTTKVRRKVFILPPYNFRVISQSVVGWQVIKN